MNRSHLKTASAICCISLALSFGCAKPAFATITGDQNPLSEEEIAGAIATGQVASSDPEEEQVSTYTDSFFECYSGADRFEVSAMEAKAAFSSSSNAILVGENGWADALSAAGLAGTRDCPILLTQTNGIPSVIQNALSSLKVSKVTIVGGPATVAPGVEQTLRNMGISVDRIGGADRYEVQTNIFNAVADSWTSDTIFISSGVRFPDALSISPASFKAHAPIFLANDGGSLNKVQKQFISSMLTQGKINRAVITGGVHSVSSETESYLKSLKKSSGGNLAVERLGGADRYEASANIADWAVRNGILSWNGTALAMSSLPYDALCGSTLQGKRGSALLIVDGYTGNNQHAYNRMKWNKGSFSSIRIFGGEASIPTTVRMDVADIFGIPYFHIPGFKVYIDAGHGFNDSNNGIYDPGAVGNGYQEATLTAELANKVSNILRSQYGVQTFVNDDGGWYKLRHAEAQQLGCDMIVSIHFNSYMGNGTETLIHSHNAHPRSWGLQDTIHPLLVEGTGLRDRGQKTQQVAILSGPLPATLLEVAFIDNSSDMRTYQSRKDIVASKIAEGIARYVGAA